ncbi:GDSL-type esterase/lipase family protein [Streptosporangium lutulentum]
MALGDSITGSPGCWRAILWNRLANTGHTDIDFVGTLPPQGCGLAYDGENEGHGGALVTGVADQNQLPGWLSATRPDIVMMHFGTNDVWSNRPTATILSAYGKLVDQMRASNPDMKILVAQIIPMDPPPAPSAGSGRPRSTPRSPAGRRPGPPRDHPSSWSTSGRASAPRPTPTTGCTPTRRATRRSPTGGSPP